MTTKQRLPEGWKFEKFPRCILKKPVRVSKISETSYLEEGKYPIVDQGSNSIAGYTNDEKKVYKHDTPLIVFGDHTRIFKYIDFDFAIGADGTKIIHPNTEIVQPKYFYYVLKAADFPNDGYNRHYKYIQDLKLPIPLTRGVQIAIASDLEHKMREVEKMRQAALRQKAAINAMQGAVLREAFPYKAGDKLPEGWKWESLDNLFTIDKQQIDRTSPLFPKLPFIGLENIESNTRKYIPSDTTEESSQSTCFLFDETHVLYGKLRPYLNKVYLPNKPGRCSMELLPLRPKNGYSRDFIGAVLQSGMVLDYAVKHSTGIRMPRADMNKLVKFKVPIPISPEGQNFISDELNRKMERIEKMRRVADRQLEAIEALPEAYLREVFEFGET